MSKEDSKEAAGQEAVDQEPVIQEPLNQEPVDQEPVIQEPLNQEPADQVPVHEEPVNQEPVIQETLDQDALDQIQVDIASALTKDNPEVFPLFVEFLCRGTINSVTLFTSNDPSRRTTAGIFNAIVFAANHRLSLFQDRLMTAHILTDEPLSIPIWAEHYAKVERGNIFRDYVAQVIAYELGIFWGPAKEIDRDEVAKMLTGDRQLNGEILPNGGILLNGGILPNGDTLPNGDALPNGHTLANGDTHPNGVTHLNGDIQLTVDEQLLEDVLDYMKPIPGSMPTHPNIAPVCFYHLHATSTDCPDTAYPMSAWIM